METKNSIRRFLLPKLTRGYVIRLACVAVGAYLLFGHILRPMRVAGKSMEPTYTNGQFNFCVLWRYRFAQPTVGDIVMVKFTGSSIVLFKRVVALAEQTVEFRQGELLVDGVAMDEPYASQPCDWHLPPRTVKPGHVYVIGDNRSVPMDNHDFGQTPANRIIGAPLW